MLDTIAAHKTPLAVRDLVRITRLGGDAVRKAVRELLEKAAIVKGGHGVTHYPFEYGMPSED